MTSKRLRATLATEEDLERIFGSGGLLIGFPVRPTPEHETEHDEDSVDED